MGKTLKFRKHIIRQIVKEVSVKIRKANDEVFKPYAIRLSNKNLSEIIGKIMEKTAADKLSGELHYPVLNAQTDSDPDLTFTKIGRKMEIKVTSTLTAWIGGEFSKRPFDYFLVSWGGDFDEFFVAQVHLTKKDWHSHIHQSFYGPSFTAKDLYHKKAKIVFLGGFETFPTGGVKLVREKVTI
jgi:hypothetical protein